MSTPSFVRLSEVVGRWISRFPAPAANNNGVPNLKRPAPGADPLSSPASPGMDDAEYQTKCVDGFLDQLRRALLVCKPADPLGFCWQLLSECRQSNGSSSQQQDSQHGGADLSSSATASSSSADGDSKMTAASADSLGSGSASGLFAHPCGPPRIPNASAPLTPSFPPPSTSGSSSVTLSPASQVLRIGQRVADELDERMTDEFMRHTRDHLHMLHSHERRASDRKHVQQFHPSGSSSPSAAAVPSSHRQEQRPDEFRGLRKMSDTDELPSPALLAQTSPSGGGDFSSGSSPSLLLLATSPGSDGSPLLNGLSTSDGKSSSGFGLPGSAADAKHSAGSSSNSRDEQASKRQRASRAGINRVKLPPLRTTSEPITIRRTTGLDIGGTLCKVTFFEPHAPDKDVAKTSEFIKSSVTYGTSGVRDPALSFKYQNGTFHFLHFLTHRMDGAFNIIKQHNLKQGVLLATGGGAFKFAKEFKDKLDATLKKRDEMICLISGLNFLLQHVADECYYLESPERPLTSRKVVYPMNGDVFPYLLVNIGSGVSILRVDSETEFERVGGSCIGGGTYWGLCRLLTNAKTFENAMDLCVSGNYNKVDMLVQDIYGGDYERFSLPSSTVASAFGKLVMSDNMDKNDWSPSDVAASLLHMIGGNIAQLAYLTAKLEKTNRICFSGNFLRRNLISAGFLSYSIDYWSGGQMKALFLKHEGYFGSLGALLTDND